MFAHRVFGKEFELLADASGEDHAIFARRVEDAAGNDGRGVVGGGCLGKFGFPEWLARGRVKTDDATAMAENVDPRKRRDKPAWNRE